MNIENIPSLIKYSPVPNKDIVEYDRKKCIDRFLFRKAKKIEGPVEKLIFYSDNNMLKTSTYDFLPTDVMILLVNEKVIKILQENIPDNEIQYFDAVVKCGVGELSNYKAINLLATAQAIDYKKSKLEYFKDKNGNNDGVYGCDSLFHKPNSIEDKMIARDKDYMGHVLVSPKLVAEFKKNKIKGAHFIIPNGERY